MALVGVLKVCLTGRNGERNSERCGGWRWLPVYRNVALSCVHGMGNV